MKLRYKIILGVFGVIGVAIVSLALYMSHNADCPPAPTVAEGVETMQAVVNRCYGSPDVLALESIEKPAPGPNEVLVRVRAAGVNPLDWHYMRGEPYIMRVESGFGRPGDIRLGVDFAGVVEAVGESVTMFAPGDEVFGGRNGAFAEYITVPEDRAIAKKPASVSFEEAAGIPIAALTALQALRDKGKVESGDRVLINGASGGVGTFAVQMAKAWGAEVSGVCSTRNVERVRSLGADEVIDYKRESYVDGGQEWDVIIDNVGNHRVSANKAVLADNGRFVIVGGAKGNWIAPFVNPVAAMLTSSDTGQTFDTLLASLNKEDLETVAQLMADGAVKTVIDRRYSLADVPEAIRYSESGRARGKIIITID